MDLGIKGRVALITGGSRGIGRAAALQLAAEGVRVALAAREREGLDAVAREVADASRIEPFTCETDCTSESDVKRLVSKTVEKFGTIDILVNSIGDAAAGHFWELTEEDWTTSLSLKLLGQIRTVRLALPHMRKQRWGRIINVNGGHGKQPPHWALPAAVTNAGLTSFTKGLVQAVAKDNVLVNCVSPGPVDPEDTRRLRYMIPHKARVLGVDEARAKEIIIEEIPLGRMVRAQEVASMIVFLASELASGMTGTNIDVDGGWVKCT
jgi:NAD(P)-dependent dehydrogenase (short-subunit alcohol dehydrogenase family)